MIEFDPDNVPIIYFQNGKRKNGVDSARAFLLFDEFQDYYNRRKTLKAKYPHLKEYRKRYKQHVLDKAEYKAKQNEIIKERQKGIEELTTGHWPLATGPTCANSHYSRNARLR